MIADSCYFVVGGGGGCGGDYVLCVYVYICVLTFFGVASVRLFIPCDFMIGINLFRLEIFFYHFLQSWICR